MTDFSYTANLNTLQIELSTNCNALCLGCVRTEESNYNQSKSYIKRNIQIDPEIILNVLNSTNGKDINKIEFNGNIDEPFTYKHLEYLIENILQINRDMAIVFHTNGGVNNTELYYNISKLLSKNRKSKIKFGIDGLADTNHIYRQNVIWETVQTNLKAVIKGGCNTLWQFLVFPWNRHQVDEAKLLAKNLGVDSFILRPDRTDISEIGLDKIKNIKIKNNFEDNRPQGGISKYKKVNEYHELGIDCLFKEMNALFISWEGKVWPCCFISNMLYSSESDVNFLYQKILKGNDLDFNNLNKRSFDEILSDGFFQSELMKSWHEKTERSSKCFLHCHKNKKRVVDGGIDNKKPLEFLNLN